jgi:predicted HicB family RNase H-like nuclease
MKYKGYTGVVEFDEESGVLFGHVIGLRDGITFQGDSVAEVTQAFHDSVDDYLEFCAERGESPEKPYSGQFVLRIDPQLHRVMSHAAEERGASLNSLIEERLKEAFGLAGSRDYAAKKARPKGAKGKQVPRPGSPKRATGTTRRRGS